MNIAVGDAVRIHYHPPGWTRSFVEGVVSRVEMATSLGRGFMVDVTYDVIHRRSSRDTAISCSTRGGRTFLAVFRDDPVLDGRSYFRVNISRKHPRKLIPPSQPKHLRGYLPTDAEW